MAIRNGSINGTPTTSNTYGFVVMHVYAGSCVCVDSASSLVVTTPAGGATLTVGQLADLISTNETSAWQTAGEYTYKPFYYEVTVGGVWSNSSSVSTAYMNLEYTALNGVKIKRRAYSGWSRAMPGCSLDSKAIFGPLSPTYAITYANRVFFANTHNGTHRFNHSDGFTARGDVVSVSKTGWPVSTYAAGATINLPSNADYTAYSDYPSFYSYANRQIVGVTLNTVPGLYSSYAAPPFMGMWARNCTFTNSCVKDNVGTGYTNWGTIIGGVRFTSCSFSSSTSIPLGASIYKTGSSLRCIVFEDVQTYTGAVRIRYADDYQMASSRGMQKSSLLFVGGNLSTKITSTDNIDNMTINYMACHIPDVANKMTTLSSNASAYPGGGYYLVSAPTAGVITDGHVHVGTRSGQEFTGIFEYNEAHLRKTTSVYRTGGATDPNGVNYALATITRQLNAYDSYNTNPTSYVTFTFYLPASDEDFVVRVYFATNASPIANGDFVLRTEMYPSGYATGAYPTLGHSTNIYDDDSFNNKSTDLKTGGTWVGASGYSLLYVEAPIPPSVVNNRVFVRLIARNSAPSGYTLYVCPKLEFL